MSKVGDKFPAGSEAVRRWCDAEHKTLYGRPYQEREIIFIISAQGYNAPKLRPGAWVLHQALNTPGLKGRGLVLS